MPDVPSMQTELVDREERFWIEGGGNPEFWSRYCADDGLVALPMGIMDKSQTVAAMKEAAPWAQAAFHGLRFVCIADDVGALAYHATARRASDETDYTAVVSSVYVRRDDDWLLVFHQQAPTSGS